MKKITLASFLFIFLILSQPQKAVAMTVCDGSFPITLLPSTEFSCGGFTFKNFRSVVKEGDNNSSASIFLVTANEDNGQVYLNVNPSFVVQADQTSKILILDFDVLGSTSKIGFADGGDNTQSNIKICNDTDFPNSSNCASGETAKANFSVQSGNSSGLQDIFGSPISSYKVIWALNSVVAGSIAHNTSDSFIFQKAIIIPTNTPPTITLVGSNPLNLTVGDNFTDPGATANDNEDGDLTSSIVRTGSVNASTTGTYTLTYVVKDSGNLYATTTRTVIVSATTTPPVIPPVNTLDNGGGGGGGGNPGGHRHPVVVGEILGATSCLYLRDYLKIDWQNDPIEVLKLQSFLNVFEKENLSYTGVFSQETFEAVQRFQTKYSGDILEPWGDKVTTGFVYILTKKKINEIYCNTIYPLSQTDQNEIEAFKNSGKVGSSFDSGVLDSGVIFISDDITKESPVVELKDNSLSQSVLKNIAVSLFALPQKMFGNLFNNCSYTPTLLLLILIALIIIIIKLFINSKKNSQDISVATPITEVPTEEEPPVIILPGIVKEDEKIYTPEILPDEEIVIENPEEETEETN